MTNGTVGDRSWSATAARLTVKYKGGEKKIVVPDDVPIVNLEPGDRSLLAPGAKVVLFAKKEADEPHPRDFISAGKDGVHAADVTVDAARSEAHCRSHPLAVRLTHWINAFAMVCMLMSGWAIYNASPIFPFRFPGVGDRRRLAGWLDRVAFRGDVAARRERPAVCRSTASRSGHFRRELLPIRASERAARRRARADASGCRIETGRYNAVQRFALCRRAAARRAASWRRACRSGSRCSSRGSPTCSAASTSRGKVHFVGDGRHRRLRRDPSAARAAGAAHVAADGHRPRAGLRTRYGIMIKLSDHIRQQVVEPGATAAAALVAVDRRARDAVRLQPAGQRSRSTRCCGRCRAGTTACRPGSSIATASRRPIRRARSRTPFPFNAFYPEFDAPEIDGSTLSARSLGPRRRQDARGLCERLRTLPQAAQITRHICIEGWSAIGDWRGVPFKTFLETHRRRHDGALRRLQVRRPLLLEPRHGHRAASADAAGARLRQRAAADEVRLSR